ncbi:MULTISPECIES: TetR family transcriptional regulator [Pelosinus]|uniref:Regulatory protein TetR n=1 Tax=Pelosinus fermentans B4 TaxID=1149862 RepID=I9B1C5_9FIRM|nr:MULTISPECIES: TetR family transcriptional regulator [Pelosinus]EIW18932.1 regulatory protein TetR [Pelosinus fermentans B4]EIW21857.1 transcriptional regulator, TetR family [Pelosinus fermentans A11]OAM95292.1 transcriptional regulator, TetR family [Pelosinus fermentans DSM 17108]SDR26002.1 DNA-binding transcriptional regulator, AcrR family [Pelosinus fermentans]
MKELDDKKSRLLSAAKEVLAEKGLEKATISDIVKRAGMAQGTFYLYFSSKNALIPAIANDLLQTMLHKIKKEQVLSDDIWSFFHKMITVTFQVTNSYKEVLSLCYSGLAIDNTLSEWDRIYNPYYSWLAEIIAKGIEQKAIRQDVDPLVAARMVIGLIESSAEQIYLFNKLDKPLPEHQQDLFTFIHHALEHR